MKIKLKNSSSILGISLAIVISMSSFNVNENRSKDEYDVAGIYKGIELESGSKCITSIGVEDASVVLTPAKLETGKYSVSITRKEKDIYKVDGKNIYIETKFSYEYATGDDAVLVVESNYGYSKGKLIFLD